MADEHDVIDTGLPDLSRIPLPALLTGVVPGYTPEQNAAVRARLDAVTERVLDQLRHHTDTGGCC